MAHQEEQEFKLLPFVSGFYELLIKYFTFRSAREELQARRKNYLLPLVKIEIPFWEFRIRQRS